MRLNNHALRALDGRLRPPAYDRSMLRDSVVHFGVGAFHRAHQLVYWDALARAGHDGWGVTGVGLRSGSMRSVLLAQDGLFTVVERAGTTESATVIGAMRDYLYGPEQGGAVLARLAHPDTQLVTLTVTGDGYQPPAADTGAATTTRDVEQFLERPTTWMGYLVAALAHRRTMGLGGFTVLSCDNIPGNGAAARQAVLGHAATVDETLARWIENHVSFPGSMVDRITPTPDASLAEAVGRRYDVLDQAALLTEPFRQWVVEDDFVSDRPPLDEVGVQFVSDVTSHKLVKSRLLNGTHSAMAYLGHLAGLRTSADVVADPVLRDFVERLMREEIAPLLPEVPGMKLSDYASTLIERFGNEHVGDEIARLCGRGSTKMPAYLIPSLVESRRSGAPAPLLTLALAAWFRYLRGTDLDGRPIEIRDARRDELVALAQAGGNDPGPLLRARDVMGPLGADLGLRSELTRALEDFERWGVRETVRRRLEAPRHDLSWMAQLTEEGRS